MMVSVGISYFHSHPPQLNCCN